MEERIKKYIYLVLLSNIASTAFQITVQNPIVKIILAVYTMLSLLVAIVYVKKT